MNNIVVDNSRFSLPATWNEVTNAQLLKVAPFLLGEASSAFQRKSMALLCLLPMLRKYWVRTAWQLYMLRKFPRLRRSYGIMNYGQKWDICNVINFLFDDLSGRSILRQFSHRGIEYHLPDDNFKRESIIAFAFADDYFNRFLETRDPKYINLLISCFARQKGSREYPALQASEGDPREHFSSSRAMERAEAFNTLSDTIRTAILLYFLGSKKFIHAHYAILFEKVKPEQETKSDKRKSFGQKKIPAPAYGWLGVIYDLSEQGTFGTFDQVKHMFLHTCCYYLAKRKYKQEEQNS